MFVREAAISSSEQPISPRRVGRSLVPQTTTKRYGLTLSRQVAPGVPLQIVAGSTRKFLQDHIFLIFVQVSHQVPSICTVAHAVGYNQCFTDMCLVVFSRTGANFWNIFIFFYFLEVVFFWKFIEDNIWSFFDDSQRFIVEIAQIIRQGARIRIK